MANEILILDIGPENDRGIQPYEALFLYPIAPPIVVGSQTVVVTPSSGLPKIVRESALLTEEETGRLDVGTLMFEVRKVDRMPSESEQGAADKLIDKYNNGLDTVVQGFRDRASATGVRLDPTQKGQPGGTIQRR